MKPLRPRIALFLALAITACHHRPRYDRVSPAPAPSGDDREAARSMETDLERDVQPEGNVSDPDDPLAAGEARPEAPPDNVKVLAQIEILDRNSRQITFRVRDDTREVQLQAGHEMKIEFGELPALTGMSADEALAKMREGQDIDLRVIGSGRDVSIVRLNLTDL